jgi:predicted MFS family arabinose efflux permease
LLADAVLLITSVLILRGMRVIETRPRQTETHFWRDMMAGWRFVKDHPLLMSLALVVGLWQFFYHCTLVLQILFATREQGLSERQIGLCFASMGLGTVVVSMMGTRISRAIGPGPCLLPGFGVCGLGWLQLALSPSGSWGVVSFVFMLLCFSTGAVLIFINFLSLRQAVMPAPLLGRMTSTLRWIILIPAGIGALLGGYLCEDLGLRYAIGFSGVGALLLAAWAWRQPAIRQIHVLPSPEPKHASL